MTVNELSAAIGRTGTIRFGNLRFRVVVRDVRRVFDRVDYQIGSIDPVDNARDWVSAERVTLDPTH